MVYAIKNQFGILVQSIACYGIVNFLYGEKWLAVATPFVDSMVGASYSRITPPPAHAVIP